MNNETIYITGHKNPDTDSICSAISYAWYKNQITGSDCYRPARAGEINLETDHVLKKFGAKAPRLLTDLRTQVKDLSLEEGERVDSCLSIRKAWETLRSVQKSTLVVVNDQEELEGIITIGDIARSIMEVHSNTVLAEAGTPYKNIVETLEAKVAAGDIEGRTASGKVLMGAVNPDLLEKYIEPGDMVIVADRYESQLCALEMHASCLIICLDEHINDNIIRTAQENGCIIIDSPYDSYITARLLNESIPINYFMIKDNILSFHMDDYLDDIKGTVVKVRHRTFPVLDEKERLTGIITRHGLLESAGKKVILVDHNELSQAVDGMEEADIQEIVDHHKLGSVKSKRPVMLECQPLGCTATIIYQMCKRRGLDIPADIAGLMCSAIISDTLLYRSPTCTQADIKACSDLARIAGIDPKDLAMSMFRAGSNFDGRSDEDIFYQDFKRFQAGDVRFGVGQVTSMDGEELEQLSDRMLKYMNESLPGSGLDMTFLMMTDILNESTLLLCAGSHARQKLEDYRSYPEKGSQGLVMEGVVSRKKQVIPALMAALSQ